MICWSNSGQNTMGSKPLCGDQASCVCIRHQSRPSLLVCYLNFVRRGLSGGLRQAGVTADRKPTFNLLTPAFCRILQAAGAKTVFGRQLILTREIYIEAYLNLNIWDFCLTNSEDQRLNGSLDRYFIIQRQKLGKYVGNYRTEDAFLTCNKSRPIHPILTQIGAGKHPKLDKQAICIFILHTFDTPNYPNILTVALRPAVSQCHIFRLSAILSCLMSQSEPKQYSSPSSALLIWRHKSKIDIWTSKSVLSGISCLSSLQHFRLMLETENRKIYIRNCEPGNAELHFIISRSVYCLAEFCG